MTAKDQRKQLTTGDLVYIVHHSQGKTGINPGEDTLYTRRLILSYYTGNPIRIVRGATCAGLTMEPLPPVRGFRYRGLYTVKGYGPPDCRS